MAVPKKRTTKSHQLKRRQNIFLVKPNLTKCSHCGSFTLSHRVCQNCGYYAGREVLNVLEKLTKKERKKKEKELKAKEEKEIKKEKPLSMEELSRK